MKQNFSTIDTVNGVNTPPPEGCTYWVFIYSSFKSFSKPKSKDTEHMEHEPDLQNPYNFIMMTK